MVLKDWLDALQNSDEPSVTRPPVRAWILAGSQVAAVALVKPYLDGLATLSRMKARMSMMRTSVPASPAASVVLNSAESCVSSALLLAGKALKAGETDASGTFRTATRVAPLATTWSLTRATSWLAAACMLATAVAGGRPWPTEPNWTSMSLLPAQKKTISPAPKPVKRVR